MKVQAGIRRSTERDSSSWVIDIDQSHGTKAHAPNLCFPHAWHTTELGDLATGHPTSEDVVKRGTKCEHMLVALVGALCNKEVEGGACA